jgi:hypothetical protein
MILRQAAAHALPFARYWCRPLGQRWLAFFLQFLFAIYGDASIHFNPSQFLLGNACFAYVVASWTAESARLYRRGLRRRRLS